MRPLPILNSSLLFEIRLYCAIIVSISVSSHFEFFFAHSEFAFAPLIPAPFQSANEVETARRAFHAASVDYSGQLNELISHNKYDFLEKVISYVLVQHRYFHQGYEMLKDLVPFVNSLTAHVQEARAAHVAGAEERRGEREAALEQAQALYHPARSHAAMRESDLVQEGYLLKVRKEKAKREGKAAEREFYG